MRIEGNMNIVVHPTYIRGRVLSWGVRQLPDRTERASERLHRFPEAITELG